MGWIAINGFSGHRALAKNTTPKNAGSLLCVGSFVCEFQPTKTTPMHLVNYRSLDRWTRRFSVYRNADGSFSLDCQQGPDKMYAQLSGFGANCTDLTRITLTWDALAATGKLTAENLKTGNIQQVPVSMPVALPLNDAIGMVKLGGETKIDASVRLLALADDIVPIGPSAAISACALVMTPTGNRKIEDLVTGDMVITKAKGALPIQHVFNQTVPAFGYGCPIILRAPFFGLSQDVIIASNQRMLISSIETEYDFGNENMLMEAGELVGLPGAAYHGGPDQIEYHHILLDSHECIKVCGAWTESLYIGRMVSVPSIANSSILSEIPFSTLPTHKKRARPVLQDYERRALFGALIA